MSRFTSVLHGSVWVPTREYLLEGRFDFEYTNMVLLLSLKVRHWVSPKEIVGESQMTCNGVEPRSTPRFPCVVLGDDFHRCPLVSIRGLDHPALDNC